jgi:hypothetical protein
MAEIRKVILGPAALAPGRRGNDSDMSVSSLLSLQSNPQAMLSRWWSLFCFDRPYYRCCPTACIRGLTKRHLALATRSKQKHPAVFGAIPPPTRNILAPSNFELIYGENIEPLDRLRMWDERRFERYVHEWAFALSQRGHCGKVVWAPGSGDKGRDIRAYVTDILGEWDNYQCKYYKSPLTPGDAWLELAKLCLYTHRGDFRTPRAYYFVAPHDLGPELSTLIESPERIAPRLLTEWGKTTKEGISFRYSFTSKRLWRVRF